MKINNKNITNEEIDYHLKNNNLIKTLDCSNCYNLTALPMLSNLEKLNCSNCRKLKMVPDYPKLKELRCYATKIENLEYNKNLQQNLEVLYCSSAAPNFMPKLQKLGTTIINKHSDIYYPELSHIYCDNSTKQLINKSYFRIRLKILQILENILPTDVCNVVLKFIENKMYCN